MTRDRTQLVGAAVSLLVLALLVALDMSLSPDDAILTSMFALAPLIACAVVPVAATSVIAGMSVVAAVLSGAWNDTGGTVQQDVRILNVVLVSVAAIVIAAVRVRRERRFAEVSEIAQVAQRAILPVLPPRAADW